MVGTAGGVYSIVRGASGLAADFSEPEADLEARNTSSTVADPAEPPARADSQDADEQHGIAIDLDQLDLPTIGRERITNSLLSVLPPSLRAIAGGLILLALGIAALIQLPNAITFDGAHIYQKVITPPALVLFLILLLIVVGVVAIAIFAVLLLTKWPGWVCASLAGVIVIAAILLGAITQIYPSWSSIEDFARALFGG